MEYKTPIKSTVETGIAPLIVDSTTVIANLNADKIDGLDIPTISGNGGKVLTVKSDVTGLEWTTSTSSGLPIAPYGISYNSGTNKLEFTYTQ